LIGVNDHVRGHPLDLYREDFPFILKKVIQFADGQADRVIVLAIPGYGYTLAFVDGDIEPISPGIDRFNGVIRAAAERAGARYIDVTVISRIGLDDFELSSGDRLHPSSKMDNMGARKVLPAALKILEKSVVCWKADRRAPAAVSPAAWGRCEQPRPARLASRHAGTFVAFK